MIRESTKGPEDESRMGNGKKVCREEKSPARGRWSLGGWGIYAQSGRRGSLQERILAVQPTGGSSQHGVSTDRVRSAEGFKCAV